ncbi:hypothetical protein H632_c267p1 [Helicosporidium sp. ATCC 50920]|nr:hypothetical protein H632_c267p1 [Helicosporidium sp. ATCC 50920]|eukprot:KDD76326.1 hypothetical protein H632_c267p1 [Helicosporidium sp. ATCC 50920]
MNALKVPWGLIHSLKLVPGQRDSLGLDTATGLLLTGIGHIDYKKDTNFLIVDDSKSGARRWRNDACLDAETTQQQIESAFKTFTERSDVSVLLINQSIALSIRHLLDEYTRPVPAILEIPSKDQPYDPSQDSILARVRFMFGDG